MTTITESETFQYILNKNTTIDIYKNDLKYKFSRNIDVKNLVDKTIKHEDYDSIEYRLSECKQNDYNYLDISNMGLIDVPNIPDDIVKNVKNLFMSENKFSNIKDLSAFIKVTTVDLSSNTLTKLPKLPKLIEELSIRCNNIINIDDFITYQKLKRVDCSHNNITSIPSHNALEILICNSNNIENFGVMNNLKKLSCKNNKIKILNVFPNIEILECDRNNLIKIFVDPKFEKNLLLQEIYCSHNNLQDVPVNLGNKLRILQCYDNQIKKINFMNNLVELVCDYNDELQISKKFNIESSYVFKNNLMLINFKS